MKIAGKIIVGTLSICFAGALSAAGNLPPLLTFEGVDYLTGGVGLDESAAIKAAEKDFNLSLLFAQSKRGEFVSDVRVSVADKAGRAVLEAESDGPMLLARLPAGAYKVSAEYGGKVLVRTVKVDAKGVTRVGFVWQPTAKATME
ncbi:MAG: carboxypeptidase regulatory-like domain-containing protein [Proteobacteria bacterium]|nr:carboxypeptidase regulatory-like domain-containing protein [Pseudomonadota bacterium]